MLASLLVVTIGLFIYFMFFKNNHKKKKEDNRCDPNNLKLGCTILDKKLVGSTDGAYWVGNGNNTVKNQEKSVLDAIKTHQKYNWLGFSKVKDFQNEKVTALYPTHPEKTISTLSEHSPDINAYDFLLFSKK